MTGFERCHCLTVLGQAVLFRLQIPDEQRRHCFSEDSSAVAQNRYFEVRSSTPLIRRDLPSSAGEEILPLSCYYPSIKCR